MKRCDGPVDNTCVKAGLTQKTRKLTIGKMLLNQMLQRRPTGFSGRLSSAVLTMLLGLLPSLVYAATVREFRIWRAPDHTRVVMDLSGPVTHNVITLTHPDRIVVDIDNTTLKAKTDKLDFQGSPIIDIRTGVKDKHDLRVVMDLRTAVNPRSFLLKANKEYGDRLVIDLYDKQTAQPVVKHVNDQKHRDIIVAIDAGHGGEDPGATGFHHLHEKQVVLAIAKKLNALFEKTKGYDPVMIRKGDYYVGLSQRRKLARQAQADLLVSIHADAFRDHHAHGTSVYALSRRGASSAMARILAEDANNSDLVGGVSLSDKDDVLAGVLADLSMSASLDASLKVGADVVRSVSKIARLHSRRVEQANFAVLRSPDVPSILVETGFISNPSEAIKLSNPTYQGKMAHAIFDGITDHFNQAPPPGTYLAWLRRNRDREVEYTITSGDTLSDIAERYQVTVADIRRHNDLSSDMVRVGQKILIPSS